LENKLRNSPDNVVISDCRFPNEIKSIKAAGGCVVRVVRGPDPEWFEAAANVNRGPNGNMYWATSKQQLEKLKIHPSETAWIGTEFDAVLDNNHSFDDLYAQLIGLVANRPESKSTQTC
jgi:hypothetical protein